MRSAPLSVGFPSQRLAFLNWAGNLKVRLPWPRGWSRSTIYQPHSTRLRSALRSGGILSGIAGRGKSDVLHEVSARIALPANFNRTALSNALVNPLASGPISAGDGFAISNLIHSDFIVPERTSLTVCFLDQPVDFGTSDGMPVHTLLVLFSRDMKDHLRTLASLASALQCDRFRSVLRGRPSDDAVRQEFIRVSQT